MSGPARSLDPRAWLVWGFAASLPPLLGRNPFVLLATLLAVLGVRAAWGDAARGPWGGLVRLAAVVMAIGVVFNVLTVHVGDRVIGRLPAGWPLIGGDLTLNALVYGLLSGTATLSLIVTGLTVGALLDWATVLRLLPGRLTGLAVAGAIAWGMVPQSIAALREIREAQAARGFRPRGLRDAAPLVLPLLAGGLERSFAMAETLESRAFGAPPSEQGGWLPTLVGLVGATVGVVGGYLLAVGSALPAAVCLGVAGVALWLGLRGSEPAGVLGRTRYRDPRWERRDSVVTAASAAVVVAVVAALAFAPGALGYEPYPSLVWPEVSLPLLVALGLLLAPAAVA